LPNVELFTPLTKSKNVFKPSNFTKKLVHIGAVAIKIVSDLKILFLLEERK
jgi:hypothetical protein